MGFDEHSATCAASLPDAIYLAVRCGNPLPSAGSWAQQDKPCAFTVR